MRSVLAIVTMALMVVACAAEGEPQLEADLLALRSEVTRALHALDTSIKNETFESLGESVSRLEAATNALGEIESREDIEDGTRAQAALFQARAWDDLARTLVSPRSSGDAEEASWALGASLRQKALPARVAALAAYERTRALLCQFELRDDPAMIESLDGIARYGGRASVEAPCD